MYKILIRYQLSPDRNWNCVARMVLGRDLSSSLIGEGQPSNSPLPWDPLMALSTTFVFMVLEHFAKFVTNWMSPGDDMVRVGC